MKKLLLMSILMLALIFAVVSCTNEGTDNSTTVGQTTDELTVNAVTTAEEVTTEEVTTEAVITEEVTTEEVTTEEVTTEEVTTEEESRVESITIATYNIRHGADVDCDWTQLAEIILQSGADIIGLQEVDMNTNRIGGLDTMAGLAEATGYPYYYFAAAMDYDGGQYGTAILSRYPSETHKTVHLNNGGFEPRACGAVTVILPDGSPFCFLNTHLSYEDVTVQAQQFIQIEKWMKRNMPQNIPTVITGDFNTADFTAFSPFEKKGYALVNNAEHSYPTFRGSNSPIDNIVYLASYLTPVEHGMIDSDRSDHNLLWCQFKLN